MEEDSFVFMMTSQECLIQNIYSAYQNEDDMQLCKSIQYLNNYLISKQPKIFPLLLDSPIISLLIKLASPDSMLKCRNSAYSCLYNITAIYSETTPTLLNNGILDVFYDSICNIEFNKNSNLNIDGITNLLYDQPILINQVMSQFPMVRFVGNPPFKKIISMFLDNNEKIFFSINRLFFFYLENGASQSDINLMIKFYCACLKMSNNDLQKQTLKISALNGINNYLMMNKLQEEQYSMINEIDFIDISEDLNDIYLNLYDKKEAETYLNAISYCFYIFSRLVEFSFSQINYDFRQILKYCECEPTNPFYHFNDNVGISAFELISTILMNCEADTYESFIYCTDVNFLDILGNGIINGSYYIIYPAAKSLFQVIQGCNDKILNEKFINEDVFEALLKLMLIDDQTIQMKTVETIKIIFERSIMDRNTDKCIYCFLNKDGCDVLENCMNSTENDDIARCCYNILTRFFQFD